METNEHSVDLRAGFAANLGLLLGFLALGIAEHFYYFRYVALVSEDSLVEWATVIILLPAAVLFALRARDAHRAGARSWWFLAGLTAFCLFFAGEEISWGQRLFTYQPPAYFLEHNDQQELNFHNMFKDLLRTKYILMAILVVWCMALPLLRLKDNLRQLFEEKLGILASPLVLAPSALGICVFTYVYPWRYSGEVAEAAFGGMLFCIALLPGASLRRALVGLGLGAVVSVGLAAAVTWLVANMAHDDPVARETAQREARALQEDWHSQRLEDDDMPSGCRTHIRLFTWVRKHDYQAFRDGAFMAEAPPEGEARTRWEFFLDPWNNPYWVRHVCEAEEDGSDRVYIYSFGPNGRRNSTKFGIHGDDAGVSFVVR